MARKQKKGTYLGVATSGDIRNITKVIAQGTDCEQEAGMVWYPNANRDALAIVHDYSLDLWTTSQVLSVISPLRYWNSNVADARTTVDAFMQEESLDGRRAYMASKKVPVPTQWEVFVRAWEILEGKRELTWKGGPKTYDFAKLIESPLRYMGVCVDSHAMANWSDDYTLVKGTYSCPVGLYRTIAGDYTTVAGWMGILPSQAQAKAWVIRKRLMGGIGS